MMRKILFRGKLADSGEWIYWDMIGRITTPFGKISKYTIKRKAGEGHYYFAHQLWNRLDRSTVGQYTGMRDKKKKPIFEGDIVRYYERQFGGEDAPVIQSVGFEEGGFCVHHYFLNNWLRNAVNGNIQMEGIEVIGNIHDNPELLKGE